MTVYRRGTRWAVSIHDPISQKMRWVGTFASKREAIRAEADAIAVTCDGYADRWLDYHPRPSPASNATYDKRIKPFAKRFAGLPIAALDAREALRWALTQTHGVQETTQTMLSDAVRDGIHPGPNPLAGLWWARRYSRRPAARLTEEALFDLAECAIDVWGQYGREVVAPLIITTASLRLWVSQVCALRRDDVEPERIRIQGPFVSTEAAWVSLDDRTRRAIDAVPCIDGAPWLFTSKRGRRLTPGRVFYYWSAVRAAHGRPDLRFDDLRHACWTRSSKSVHPSIGVPLEDAAGTDA